MVTIEDLRVYSMWTGYYTVLYYNDTENDENIAIFLLKIEKTQTAQIRCSNFSKTELCMKTINRTLSKFEGEKIQNLLPGQVLFLETVFLLIT